VGFTKAVHPAYVCAEGKELVSVVKLRAAMDDVLAAGGKLQDLLVLIFPRMLRSFVPKLQIATALLPKVRQFERKSSNASYRSEKI
jgi:hypothetical protein